MSQEIPDRVLAMIKKRSAEIDWGSIRIDLTSSGYMDVIIEEKVRYAAPERSKTAYKPRAGQIVGENSRTFVVKREESG